MSNNNIIDGSGVGVESFVGNHQLDISAPSGATDLTEAGGLGVNGDIVAYGSWRYSDPSQDANINHNAGSWKSSYASTTLSTGNVGAAWMYNKSTGVTTELVEPSATKSRQGGFGQYIYVTNSYIYVNSKENGYSGLEGKIHIFDHSGNHVNTIIGPSGVSDFASGDGGSGPLHSFVANDNFLFVTAIRYPNNLYRGAIFIYSADGSTLLQTLTVGSNYAFRYRSLGIRGDKLVSTDGSFINVWDISNVGGAPSMNTISTGSGNNGYVTRSVTFINDDFFVVGHRYSSISPSSGDQGSLRVFRVSDCAQVFAYDNPAGYVSTNDFFGQRIVSDPVNNTIAVGTSSYDTRSGVYIFSANNDGSLTHETTIFPSDVSNITPSNHFGTVLAFDGNGGTLLIGDSKSDSGAGSVSIFDVGTMLQPRTITVTGHVQQGSFSPYVAGGYSTEISSGYFDIAASSDFVIGTSAFTMEFWFKVKTALTAQTRVFGLDSTSQANDNVWFNLNASTDSSVITPRGTANITGVNFNDGAWHHVAWTKEDGLSTSKIFIDGQLSLESENDSNAYPNASVTTPSPRIMNNSGHVAISDMRLIIGTAVYTEAFTPPTEPLTLTNETVLLTCNKPYMSALSTVSGDVSTERSAPYSYVDYSAASHGGSAYFDGNGDRVNIAPTADFHFGTEDFTIEFWMKPIPNGYASSDHTVMSHSITSNTSNGWRIVYNESTKAIKWGRGNGVHCNAPGLIEANVWNHVAITRANSTFGMFINGVIVPHSVYAESASYTPSTDLGLYIGGYDTNVESASVSTSRNVFSGFLSDVRVVKGSAVYAADFTPPTAPLTAVTGTKLLLPFDDATIFDKSGSAVVFVKGDVAVSDVAPPYVGGKSFTFDGSSDYMDVDPIVLSGDFTIDFWAKMSSSLTDGTWCSIVTNGNSGITLSKGSGTQNQIIFSHNGSMVRKVGSSIVEDTWHHYAFVRSGSTLTIYHDGVPVESGTFTGVWGDGTYTRIGTASSSGLIGELADIRIAEYAVYTDTFTPPTGSYWD